MATSERNQGHKAALDLDGVINSLRDAERKTLRNQGIGKRLAGFIGGVASVTIAVSALMIPPALATSVAIGEGVDYWDNLSSDISFQDYALPQHTVLLDKDGNEFATFYSEDRQNVKFEEIPQTFIDALIATEDAKFWEHGGVDPVGIARAAVENLKGNRQGASTITQQLVKNLRQLDASTPEELEAVISNDVMDKLQEAKLAVEFEANHSKEDILEQYSNTVYFGSEAYGISAASLRYFNKSPQDLSIDQSALLAGLVNSPNALNPETNPEGAKIRRDHVLNRLQVTGKITPEQFAEESAKPIELSRGQVPNGCGTSAYPYYCGYVVQEILTNPAFGSTPEIRAQRLKSGNMTIRTALDRKVNDRANVAASEALGNDNRVATAAVTVEPGTGRVLSFAQNRTFDQTQINLSTSAFQVGSSFKPITLATALSQGLNPRDRLNSNGPYFPAGMDAPPGGFNNYNLGINYGNTDAYFATANSLNVYYVRLIQQYGVIPVADMATSLGITSLPRTGERALQGQEASLTLGAYDVTPLEMATAYATFASGGVHCDPVASLEVTRTSTGEKLEAPQSNCQQAITPYVANQVSDILQGVVKQGGTSPEAALRDRESAGKSGTTNDYAATWFVGYTPQLSTAVWVGDPRGGFQYPLVGVTALGKYFDFVDGSYIAAPIWKSVMDGALEGVPAVGFPKPQPTIATSIPQTSVPNVVGLEIGQAIAVLREAGYEPILSESTKERAGANPNSVVEQSQPGGSVQTADKSIVLTLSQGSDPTMQIPSKNQEAAK